ncbi:MAG: alpha/beta hydrolase [Pseudomonadales bacterium]|nr:alpha/beta hydrolase [Pseudomonadales bacterium]
MTILFVAALLIVVVVVFGPRPRLGEPPGDPNVPQVDDLTDLAAWLREKEASVPGLIDGADARVVFANPDTPAKTELCFVYIHGFSATWPETAPVTSRIAETFGANVLQARLAGHGVGHEPMTTPAEAWLESMLETWRVARQLGNEIVLVATSTGAPLAIWLATRAETAGAIKAMLFMSPNFGIRSKFDFLLTMPWSRYWIHWFIGRVREWAPQSELEAKYWTWKYSTLSLIEMQKVVDWCNAQAARRFTWPLAMMYMKNDPTVDPAKAIRFFERWGGRTKALIPVTLDGEVAQHVFAGDITAPHRTDWAVQQFTTFLSRLG